MGFMIMEHNKSFYYLMDYDNFSTEIIVYFSMLNYLVIILLNKEKEIIINLIFFFQIQLIIRDLVAGASIHPPKRNNH